MILTYLGELTDIQIDPDQNLLASWHDGTSHASTEYTSLLHVAPLSRLILDLLAISNASETCCPILQKLDHLVCRSGLPAFVHFNVLKLWDLARGRNKGYPKAQLNYFYQSIIGSRFVDEPSDRLDADIRAPQSSHISRCQRIYSYATTFSVEVCHGFTPRIVHIRT